MTVSVLGLKKKTSIWSSRAAGWNNVRLFVIEQCGYRRPTEYQFLVQDATFKSIASQILVDNPYMHTFLVSSRVGVIAVRGIHAVLLALLAQRRLQAKRVQNDSASLSNNHMSEEVRDLYIAADGSDVNAGWEDVYRLCEGMGAACRESEGYVVV